MESLYIDFSHPFSSPNADSYPLHVPNVMQIEKQRK